MRSPAQLEPCSGQKPSTLCSGSLENLSSVLSMLPRSWEVGTCSLCQRDVVGCNFDVKCMHVVFSRTLLDSNVLALLCFLLAYIRIYEALTGKQFFFFFYFFFFPLRISIFLMKKRKPRVNTSVLCLCILSFLFRTFQSLASVRGVTQQSTHSPTSGQ